MTAAGELLPSGAAVWQQHPNPMLRREKWLSLNGEWKFRLFARPEETMDAGKRKELEAFLKSIDEDDNNYIFIGKLKMKFGHAAKK